MFSKFTRLRNVQASVVESPLLTIDDSCIFCNIVTDNGNEVKKAIEKAKNRSKIDIQKFYKTPICSIKTPTGQNPLSLSDIELMYEKDFPTWKEEFQCFPEAPIFYDKLFKKSPSKRAFDIEISIQDLKNKIELMSAVPFDLEKDSDDEIVTKALDSIIQSLHSLIDHLKLEENPRIKDGLPKILKGKLKSNMKELKDVNKVIGTLNEVQMDGFELVVDNHKTFREQHGYYKMRSVKYCLTAFHMNIHINKDESSLKSSFLQYQGIKSNPFTRIFWG